ncbi:response regulator [Flavobacterium sp.]|uniref:response regulator n=1 Tax=Flavobacterium sp. TaxID=239 RepID=UPI0037519B35
MVEDDAISKLLITKVVSKYSQEILSSTTGVKAIEICKDNPDIDLVMMDIYMPEMNGYEATKQIRQFNKKVIIIAQTANAFTSDKIKAIDSGCNDYISKPINMDILNELLQIHFT